MLTELNLSECEKEQIHIPNLIQPYGFVIVFNKQDLLIKRCSQNFDNSSIGPISNLFNKPIYGMFPYSISRLIEKNIDFSVHKRQVILNQSFPEFIDRPINIILCDAGSEVIIELFSSFSDADNFELIDFHLNHIIRKIVTTQDMYSVFEIAVNEIKTLTGYDRVMVYRFDEDFNGEVIAEAREPGMESYLNLHYPASDIPSQARELYRKNMIRTIMDVHYSPIKIINEPGVNFPLDMSYSSLRSVSPIHLEYLQNMGVGATMTISLMVNDRLWGLISCHHRTGYLPDIKRLNIAEVFGNIFGGIIQMKEESEVERRNSELLARLDTVIDILLSQDKSLDLLEIIKSKLFLFRSMFSCDGFLFYTGDSFFPHDFPLNKQQTELLLNSIDPLFENQTFFTHQLYLVAPGLPEEIHNKCAGLMALRVDTSPKSYWIWSREEKTLTISWGGNPSEKAIINPKGVISPRKSFEKYNQVVTNKAPSWDTSERELSKYLISQIYRLFEFYESGKQLESHKQQILHMEEERAKHYEELIEMLVGVIEQRDAYTAGHTRRVAEYCEAIAREMRIDEESISRLREAAILHDIGKVIIPDSVLLKPGKLSSKEYQLIKMHLKVGYEILEKIDYYKPLAEIIKYHHEKYDGSGYPEGKKGDEIPLLSQIMIVADAFDAMTSNRIYQPRRTTKEAIAELIKYKSTWYHPDVVDAAVIVTKRAPNQGSMTTQLPFTQLEKERFSYFFKDQLTGVYNDTYLWMIIQNLIPEYNYNHFLLVELRGMSGYNHKNGWHQGNNIIQKYAEFLIFRVKEEQLFRVFGDDFVICFKDESERNTFMKNWVPIEFDGVGCTCSFADKDIFLEIH